jgi:hypothetical protein
MLPVFEEGQLQAQCAYPATAVPGEWFIPAYLIVM